MVLCEVCGNEIPDDERVCRFCGAHQHGVGSAARARGGGTGSRRGGRGDGGRAGGVRTVNLKRGLPGAEQALSNLDLKLDTWRRQGVRLVRVIHGYGSSGRGGALREAVRRHLTALRGRGLVRDWAAGEDLPDGSAAARGLLARHAALRGGPRGDRGNPGITIVEL